MVVINIIENQDEEKVKWNSPNSSFIIDFVVGRNGYIYIEASVNDTTGLLLFDTGASISIVNEKFVIDKKMKLSPYTITDSKGIHQTKDLYKVKKMVLGEIEIKRLQVYPKDSITWTDPKGLFYKQDSIIGIIGNNIISNYIWDFDLMNRKVKVSKSKAYCSTLPDSLAVPLFWNKGNKDIPVRINGAERMLTFDFGASSPLTLSDSIPNNFTEENANFTGHSSGALSHLDSTKRKGSNMDFVNVKLGTYTFNEVLCTENDHSNLLGLPFIWAFERVVVDYLNDKVYFINENRNSEGRGKINLSRYNIWCNAREAKDSLIISVSNSKPNNGRYKFYGNSTMYLSPSGMDSVFYRDSLLRPNGLIEYGPATWINDN
jgi:hypothetical protein